MQRTENINPTVILRRCHPGILSVEEGHFSNGKWQPERRMNGDQDHQGRHLRIPEGNSDKAISINIAIMRASV